MFKLIAGKKYVRRNGEVVTLKQCKYNASWLTDGKWVFNPEHPDKEGYCVFYGCEDHHDIVAPYKAPRKASSPYKKLLTAKQGDIFLLKGEKFIVKDSIDFRIFLTSCDRKNLHGYSSIHVRNSRKGVAIFPRQELIDLLRSGKYYIS